jgi:hypothetical protein
MNFVIQYNKGSVLVLDHADTYDQAMVLRDELAANKPSQWFEVIDSSELANLFT